MFEHYLHHHRPDSRRRLRLAVATHLAAAATAGALGFTWLMGKMQIAQVAPPAVQYVLVQMSVDTPPPPAPPPAPAAPRTEPEEPPDPQEETTQPPDVTEVLPPPKPRSARVPIPSGAVTSPSGNPFGIPGVGPGVPGGDWKLPPGFRGVAVARPEAREERAPVPFAVVQAQAVFMPKPDQNKLAATRSGKFTRLPGDNETSFCIDATGKTTDVRTAKRFPGDPEIDEICRDTVKTWRFRPFNINGKAVKTCSVQTFSISFR